MFARLKRWLAKFRHAGINKVENKPENQVTKLGFVGDQNSLLSVRLIQPFTQTENKNVFESWIVNFADKNCKRVLIDIKVRRLYLFNQATGKRLDKIWILPDDPNQWDDFIYNSIFPEFAI